MYERKRLRRHCRNEPRRDKGLFRVSTGAIVDARLNRESRAGVELGGYSGVVTAYNEWLKPGVANIAPVPWNCHVWTLAPNCGGFENWYMDP